MSRSVSMLERASTVLTSRGSTSALALPQLLRPRPRPLCTLAPRTSALAHPIASCSRPTAPIRARSFHTSPVRAKEPETIPHGTHPYPLVRLRDDDAAAEGRSTLGSPRPLSSIHGMYDPRTHVLIVRAPVDIPIVQIVERAALAEAAARRQATDGSVLKGGDKQIQIRWSAAPNDIDLKIRHVRELLERGTRVQILILPRGRQQAPQADKNAMVERFAAGLEDVAEQWREIDITGQKGTMYWQPRKTVRAGAIQAHLEKDRVQKESKEVRRQEQREKHEKRMAEVEAKRKAAQAAAAAQAAQNQKEAEALWGPTPPPPAKAPEPFARGRRAGSRL